MLSRTLLIALLSVGCVTSGFDRVQKYRAMSEPSRELYDKYYQFMTESQQERFLLAPSDEERQKQIADLRIEERLARYPKYVQDAIWSKEVVPGMDKAAVLLTWGKPDRVERSSHEESRGVEQELWVFDRSAHGQRDYKVTIVQGVVTVVDKP